MTTVKVDDATFDKLLAADGAVLLVSETGRIAGEFRPRAEASYEPLGRTFATVAELEEYLATAKLVTAEQVEQRLRELRKCA